MHDKLAVCMAIAQRKEEKYLSCNLNILEKGKGSEVLETTTMEQAIN